MASVSSSIATFLLARIADDERAVDDGRQNVGGRAIDTLSLAASEDVYPEPYLVVDPARVLADCKAKRAVVEQWASTAADDAEVYPGLQAQAQETLEALAAVYADHPDYDQSWA